MVFSRLLLAIVISISCTVAFADGCEKLVWADEFNDDGFPDSDKWSYDIGGGGWGNNELQFYTSRKENAYVENGFLTIKAIKENYDNRNYTSARLVTKNKGDWKYGRFEVRAKLPGGRGTWPAIWMLPTDWEYGGWPASGEIDIMEHVGYDMNTIHGTVHTADYNHLKGTQRGGSKKLDNVTDQFHVYAIDWTENRIDFFIDGEKYYTFYREGDDPDKWPFDKRFHLILNIAIGGNWGGVEGVDDDIFPTELVLDYIRVYQTFSELEVNGPTVVTEEQKAVEFNCSYLPDVTYEWEVLNDAEIVEGTGTNSIKVNWGKTEGIVKVKAIDNGNCSDLFGQLPVSISFSPDVKKLLITDFNGNGYASLIENENVSVNTNDEFGEIKADKDGRKLTFEFDRPYNLTNLALLKIAYHGQGLNTQYATIFLVDEELNQTQVHQLNVEANGQNSLLHLGYDFTGASSEIDLRRVKKVVIRIDYSQSDVKIKELAFYSTEKEPASPNNLRLLKKGDKYYLWWENSATALNYDILFSPEENGDYYVLNPNVFGNQIPYEINFTSIRKYYRVVAKNDGGISEPSSFITEQSVGINTERISELYSLRHRKLIFTESIENVSIYSLEGKIVIEKQNISELSLEELSGVFIIKLEHKNEFLTDKINL